MFLGRQIFSESGGSGIRFIRDYARGSNANANSHWIEIKAFVGVENIALNKKSSIVKGYYNHGSLELLTDGQLGDYYGLDSGNPDCIQVDLGANYPIDKIVVWHYFADGRFYYGTKTEVSSDGVNWKTIFDSAISGTYPETPQGHTILLNN